MNSISYVYRLVSWTATCHMPFEFSFVAREPISSCILDTRWYGAFCNDGNPFDRIGNYARRSSWRIKEDKFIRVIAFYLNWSKFFMDFWIQFRLMTSIIRSDARNQNSIIFLPFILTTKRYALNQASIFRNLSVTFQLRGLKNHVTRHKHAKWHGCWQLRFRAVQ